MYPQLSLPADALDEDTRRFQKCLTVANWLLVLSVIILTVSIAVSFVFPENFSLASQMIAHVGTIVVAGVLKVGYVLRCVALKGLGEEV